MHTTAISLVFLAIGWYSSSVDNCVSAEVRLEPLNKTTGSCNPYQVDYDPSKIVCLCNSKNPCGQLKFDWPQKPGQASLVQSSEAGLRFNVSDLDKHQLGNSSSNVSAERTRIEINLNTEHQTILGWGGAFTDSAGINMYNLSSDVASELIKSYYGDTGLQYNFGRVPIGGSDFSNRSYSYDDTSGPDYKLKSWALAEEDLKYKIPFIKMARQMANASGVELKLFGSTWSPPKWMKTSNNLARGFLIDDEKIYKSYAEYLMKFYDAYEEHGIKFWGATVQNEPIAAYLPSYSFNSLQMENKQMIKFISKYLGPALEARGKTKENFKLMVGDDSLGLINIQVPEVMANQEVQKYVAGLAFHWYTSGIVPYDLLSQVYETIKDKTEFVLMTEACQGSLPFQKRVDIGSWNRGQGYAADIIEDLARHTNGWIDWNLALDLEGGPNWAENFVDSAILVDGSKNEFYMQPMYYALAHFSRFFRPGSVRMENQVKSTKNIWAEENIMTSAVLNKETGHLVINILNKSPDERTIDLRIYGTWSNCSAKITGQSEQEKCNANIGLGFNPNKVFVIKGKSMNTVVLKL